MEKVERKVIEQVRFFWYEVRVPARGSAGGGQIQMEYTEFRYH